MIDGKEPGELTRIFIADKKLKPFEVQYHTHRYAVTITVLKGDVTHHRAVECATNDPDGIEIPKYHYKSFLNGGGGLEFAGDVFIRCNDYKIPIGGSVALTQDEYHTMSVSKGSIWIVQEHGFMKDSSEVLGIPFVADGLYNEQKLAKVGYSEFRQPSQCTKDKSRNSRLSI